MPSEKEIHPVLSRSQYDRQTDKSKCLIDNCSSSSMKVKHIGNLVAHLNRLHKEEFEKKNKRPFPSDNNKSLIKLAP